MADFVDCNLDKIEPESVDIFANDEPPAMKKRGANIKYKFVEEVESFDDLKEKAKNEGLKNINTQNGNGYYKCKTTKCCYKWKAKRNDDFKYLIYETENGHEHGDGNVELKSGLTKKMKDIVDQRIIGNEKVNASALIQAFLNSGITNLPTSKQINNYVNNKKKTLHQNKQIMELQEIDHEDQAEILKHYQELKLC